MFDYEKLIEEYEINLDIVQSIVDDAKSEFPDDEMMIEIHIIRALKNYVVKMQRAG